jgi:hypothetical protein
MAGSGETGYGIATTSKTGGSCVGCIAIRVVEMLERDGHVPMAGAGETGYGIATTLKTDGS